AAACKVCNVWAALDRPCAGPSVGEPSRRAVLACRLLRAGRPADASAFLTPAVAAQTSTPPIVSPTVPIVILGTDALLAALPATPVQLAHACLRAGFANVVPASWGDELIASAVLR